MVIKGPNYIIDRKNSIITVGDTARYFPSNGREEGTYSKFANIFFETVAHMLLHGWIQRQALFDHIYGDSSDGGPNQGLSVLDVHFVRWRPHLQNLGLKIVREKRAGTVWYKVASEPEHV